MSQSCVENVFITHPQTAIELTRADAPPRVRSFPAVHIAGLSCLLFAFSLRSMQDPDIGWHLRNAAQLVQRHGFVRSDAYSFTLAGIPWVDPEWLAEVLFYAGWRIGAVLGLYGVMLGLLEIIFVGLFVLASRTSGSNTRGLFTTSIGILLATVSYGPRTLLFGWFCLVLELLLLQAFFHKHRAQGLTPGSSTRDRALLLLLPVLFAFWINLHGSWLIGVVVLGIAVASASINIQSGLLQNRPLSGQAQRQLWAIALVSLAALFVNPYGWHLVTYPFDLAFRQNLNIASIAEWQPTPLSSLRGRVLLGLCAVALLRQLFRPRSWNLYELGLGALGLYAGLHYLRFLFLTSLLTLPMLTRDLDLDLSLSDRIGSKTASQRSFRSRLDFMSRDIGGSAAKIWLRGIAIAALACVVFRLFQASGQDVTKTPDFPSQRATEYLKNFHPQGRVFNDFLWGGYLEWNTPQIPVFVDSRVDIFEHAGVFADYLDAIRLRNSLHILCKYRIRYVLFEKETPFTYLLMHTSGWHPLYQDEETVLLERTAGGSPASPFAPDACEEAQASQTSPRDSAWKGQ